MRIAIAAVLSLIAATPLAQNPATTTAPTLPEARSDAANAMMLRACATMTAAKSGAFQSDQEVDLAMLRGQNLPIGGGDGTHLEGGFDQQYRWGELDGSKFVLHAGRMVVETDAGWKLRGTQLASGTPAPFVVAPRLLFAQLAELPASFRQVVHVEAGKVQDRDVAILTLRLADEAAEDLALGGALPTGGGGGMFMLGGMFGGEMPKKTYSLDVAIFTAIDNGEVLRLRTKIYEDDPMLQNVRFQIGGEGEGGGGEDDEVVEGKDGALDEKAVEPGQEPIKKGLPDRKPGRTETMIYWKVDFSNFGKAVAPTLDASGTRWLKDD